MEPTLTPQQAFKEALHRAGSQTVLAEILGKKQPAISKRLNGSCRAEPDEAIAIERELGVSRQLLRPDIFGDVDPDAGNVDCDPPMLLQRSDET
jgi:DNA-binding transcriptional regulator YdaS (Cro superfamily)